MNVSNLFDCQNHVLNYESEMSYKVTIRERNRRAGYKA